MKKRLKKIPKFTSEDQERKFWSTHDSADYVDWSKAERAYFPNLRPTSRTISLRLPVGMLEDLKVIAHKQDVPYQSFIKMTIADRIKEERERA